MSSQSSVLITGATGLHGGTGPHIVRRLLNTGMRARVLVRRLDERAEYLQQLGAELVVGDLLDRRSLVRATEGVDLAYFTWPVADGIVPAAANFASALRDSGAPEPRVVVMSMAPANPMSPSPLGRAQWLAEEVLTWAGFNLSILRVAAIFHENVALLHAESVRSERTLRNNFGSTPIPWISGRDAADLGFAALVHPRRFGDGHVFYPPGSELLTHAQVAEVISRTVGHHIKFDSISAEEWSKLISIQAEHDVRINAHMAKHIAAVAGAIVADGPSVAANPVELERLIGRLPITFETFVQENKNLFDPDGHSMGAPQLER
jgi:uncharacterized protein YbjT (DUF2867 family)